MKTPEERGPFGWWAYETRDLLGLSPEQVVIGLGKYSAATIRHAEADSRDMSGPLWRALVAYYQGVAEKRSLTLRTPPKWKAPTEPTPPSTEVSVLLETVRVQQRTIDALMERVAEMLETQQATNRVQTDLAALAAKLLAPGAPEIEAALRTQRPDDDASPPASAAPRPAGS